MDALYADVADNQFGGLGGHLFWRDYEVGLFGISAGGVWSSDVDTYEISLEGEYYYGLLTFGAEVGFARNVLTGSGMTEGTDYEFLTVGDGGPATAACT